MSEVEPNIDINSSSIEHPCENMLEEKSVSGAELDIDINFPLEKSQVRGGLKKKRNLERMMSILQHFLQA